VGDAEADVADGVGCGDAGGEVAGAVAGGETGPAILAATEVDISLRQAEIELLSAIWAPLKRVPNTAPLCMM
jgi:hypothetical protein